MILFFGAFCEGKEWNKPNALLHASQWFSKKYWTIHVWENIPSQVILKAEHARTEDASQAEAITILENVSIFRLVF